MVSINPFSAEILRMNKSNWKGIYKIISIFVFQSLDWQNCWNKTNDVLFNLIIPSFHVIFFGENINQ